jgi:hypothetical protein
MLSYYGLAQKEAKSWHQNAAQDSTLIFGCFNAGFKTSSRAVIDLELHYHFGRIKKFEC